MIHVIRSFDATPRLRRGLVYLCVFALHMGALAPAWAAPAQIPLISSTGSIPKPNVMLTIDTSGSMNFRHMPETSTKVNGYAVVVKGPKTWMHHPYDTYNDFSGTTNYGGVMGGITGSTDIEQIKLRSPDINSIYYNPEVLYKPWALAGGGRKPAASITGAFIDPLKQASSDTKIDLTATSYSYTYCSRYDRRGNCIATATATDPYNAGLYYRLNNDRVNPNQASSYTEYNINGPASTTYRKYPDRTDCAGTTCTRDEERQNFANWFVYYRTRMLLTRAALSEVFANMGSVARVGWTTIKFANDYKNDTSRNGGIMSGVQLLDSNRRSTLISTLQSTTFDADGGTPLRIALNQVGKYFQNTTNTGPWSDDPVAGSSSKSSCRRSYNILTTDGYYNDSLGSGDTVGDVDGSTVGNYTPATPYRDKADTRATGYSNTLADYALKYWATDLAGSIANGVIPTDNDPATWQHLTQFTVGMGVTGVLNSKDNADLPSLTNGSLDWPDPSDSDPKKIDDLWHAAVNSRGEFYSVKSYTDLADAIKNAIGKAVYQDLREGGTTTAVKTLSTGNYKYLSQYQSTSWIGDVYAYGLNVSGQPDTAPAWRASQLVPAYDARNIVIYNPDSNSTVAFNWSSMGATNQAAFTSGSDSLVRYLRGDTTNESSSGYRVRSGRLPDFINSNVVYVKDKVDMGYELLSTNDSLGYRSYFNSKASRQNATVFVGGNGGFLHGFNASTGVETFGFVPRGVLGNLSKLASQDYGVLGGANEHQYFVDGPITESDARIGGAWRNVLVGTLGAGGKGLYALSLPVTSADGATPQVLWDLTASANNNLGYMVAPAQVGVLPDGSWKVFVGNGVESGAGTASLLVIDMATGSIDTIPTDSTSGNGLGGVTLVRNSLKQVVAAYAGDLKGRLWRFEYDATSARMRTGYNGMPLFTASTKANGVQPITAEPAVIRHPSGGTVVVFGTGKLFQSTDKADTSTQSIYGVWDKTSASQSTQTQASPFGTHTATALNRTALVEQTISSGINLPAGYFQVSSRQQTADSLGWVIDLVFPNGDKSRVVYPVQIYGTSAFIDTIVPSGNAGECQVLSGSGYSFVLPARTGGQLSTPIMDTNGDGVINSSDSAASGYSSRPDGRDAIVPGGDSDTTGVNGDERKCSIQTAWGAQTALCPDDPPPDDTKTIKARIWRRLIPLQP